MSDETIAEGNAASDTLVLEGYQWVKACGESVLSRSSYYFENASNRLVVVEQIAPEISGIVGFDDRFQDRLEWLTPCVHPSLTRLEPGGFTCGGRYYLMREHVEGQTLRQWMQHAEVTPANAQQIILSVAHALAVIHRHGAVHGAVNADQIWIDRENAVKLEICPVSTFLEPKELVQLLGLDIVHTMPPEFTSGAPLTPQSDLYELGALYYELLTGTAPRGVITRLSSSLKVDIRVNSVIIKALAPDPKERQNSIEEFCAPLLGHALVSEPTATEGGTQERPPRPASKILIAATIVLCLAASAGSVMGWKWYQQRQSHTAPVAIAEEAKPVEVIAAPTAIVTPRLGWVGIAGDANQAVMEFVLLNADEMKHLLMPIPDPDNAAVFTPPQLTRYRFEDETGKVLSEAQSFVPNERLVFSLPVKLNEPTPQTVSLVLVGPNTGNAFKSNLVTVSDAIADHRQSYAPSDEKPVIVQSPTADSSQRIPRLPTTPTASATAGDFYIYAGHLYLSNEVSLLKLEFGNAGKAALLTSDLTFQCAFSIDDTLDTLLEAESDALPTHARDLAAGGFTSKWLGLDNATLAEGKKLWTKQLFRIDTSNPELLKTAKYLLVKINHNNSLVESNYENNLIVIPLEHPNQWHSFTQDPKDTVTTGETDPAAAPATPPAAEKAPGSP